jgi:hypothetical protein
MKRSGAVVAIAAGAVLLAPPAIFLLGPPVFRLTGYDMVGVSVDYRGAALLVLLAMFGGASLATGLWMLRLGKE